VKSCGCQICHARGGRERWGEGGVLGRDGRKLEDLHRDRIGLQRKEQGGRKRRGEGVGRTAVRGLFKDELQKRVLSNQRSRCRGGIAGKEGPA